MTSGALNCGATQAYDQRLDESLEIWRKTRTLPATCPLAGSAVFRAGLDPPKVSSFTARLSCHQKGYGLGNVVESWYSTGIPPTTPK
jgi:hypothetical protein